jgi:fermentation-respiration switch protein FrsA (DUF1100 family)
MEVMSTKSSPILPKKPLMWILAAFLLLITIYGGIGLYIANIFTKPSNNTIDKPATVINSKFEDVSFITSDKVHLKGWVFPGTSDKAILLVHGLNQNRLNYDYDGVDIVKELLAKGYTVMVFDLRGYGDSEKTRIGYGFVEDRDVIAAVKVLKDRQIAPAKIGIIADSLGAISTLHAAPELTDIGAIVADSSTSDMQQLISDRMVIDKHIPRFFHPGVFLMARLVFGIPITSRMPLTSVHETPERVYLFLHGEKDTYIPHINSERLLQAANPKSQLVTFTGAEHVQTYKTNPDLYRNSVFTFLDQQLGN